MPDTQPAVVLDILQGHQERTGQKSMVEGSRCMVDWHHRLAGRLEQGNHHRLERQLKQSFLGLEVALLELRYRPRQNRMLARRILSSSSCRGHRDAPRPELAQELQSQAVVAVLHIALAGGNLAVGNLLEEPTWLRLGWVPFMSPV